MTIRPATAKDTEALAALWRDAGLTRPWNDPAADIKRALEAPSATLLVCEAGDAAGELAASVMAGYDGHRGWIYYLAVAPGRRTGGLGRQMMEAAEEWLTLQGCPKVEVIIRGDNSTVRDFYDRIGYRAEDRLLMAKWLIPPPAPQVETSNDDATIPVHDVTITYLEMTAPPAGPARPAPVTGQPLSLQRAIQPTVAFYRFIQHTVGDPWLWYERRTWSDARLAEVIQNDAVEVYILSQGGVPAGFVELDFRAMPQVADIAYFGLMPDFIGRGLGTYLLDWGVRTAWNRSPAPERLTVNTCTLDHPAALGAYQKAGFTPYRRETIKVPDPVARGIVPAQSAKATFTWPESAE